MASQCDCNHPLLMVTRWEIVNVHPGEAGERATCDREGNIFTIKAKNHDLNGGNNPTLSIFPDHWVYLARQYRRWRGSISRQNCASSTSGDTAYTRDALSPMAKRN